jgi:hypothetical protein
LKLRLLVVAAIAWSGAQGVHAASASMRFCDRAVPMSAQQQDRRLRFAALVQQELDASGGSVALVSRSGLDLRRFGVRYSHAGVSLKAGGSAPWSVRQLYYACDEQRPRLYDQGLPGFLLGTDDPSASYVSIVLPSGAAAASLERAALDTPRALTLLAATYSANAYPFSSRYQNCNQWVAELLATAWGSLEEGGELRERSQGWLARQGYQPQAIDVSHLLMMAAPFVPFVRLDDHPQEDLEALRIRTSLPASVEHFVRAREPHARRIEMCHSGGRVVIRHGWEPIAEGCRPQGGDRVLDLDESGRPGPQFAPNT